MSRRMMRLSKSITELGYLFGPSDRTLAAHFVATFPIEGKEARRQRFAFTSS